MTPCLIQSAKNAKKMFHFHCQNVKERIIHGKLRRMLVSAVGAFSNTKLILAERGVNAQKIQFTANDERAFFRRASLTERLNQIKYWFLPFMSPSTNVHKTIVKKFVAFTANEWMNTRSVSHADASGNSYDLQQPLIYDLATQTANFLQFTNRKVKQSTPTSVEMSAVLNGFSYTFG